MPNLHLIISDTAVSDMTNIFEFIARDNIDAAKKMVTAFNNTFERLKVFPNSGFKKAKYIKRNIRIAIVASHYQIIYSVNKDTLCIHRVLTGYQDVCRL